MSAEPKPVANPYARPKHHGVSFAEPLHSKPEGVTEPSKTKLPSNFVVAIFGSSQGIGAGIAAAYAKAGAYGFLLCARNETSLYRTAKSILAVKPDAKIVCQSCDVTKSEDVREIASATKIAFGRLDACIVNAGISQSLITNPEDGSTHSPRGFFEGEADAFRGVMDTNTLGLFHAARYMVPLLRESEDGAQAFVGISSAVAHMSESNYVPVSYSLSKFASARLIEQVHEAYHDSGNGVCAFSLHPGGVLTEGMGSNLPTSFDPKFLTDDVGLCGGACVWLTKEKKSWLSGRWVSSKWDMDSLEGMKDEIVSDDKLKFRMVV